MLPLLEKENTSMRGKSALSLKKVSNTNSDQLALEAAMRPNLASSPELFELTEQPNDQQAATTSPQIIGVTKKMNASMSMWHHRTPVNRVKKQVDACLQEKCLHLLFNGICTQKQFITSCSNCTSPSEYTENINQL